MFIRAARADCCPQTVVRRLYPQHPLTALNFICQIYSHAICSVTSRALHLWYGQGAGGFTTMVYTVCDFANLTGRSVVLGRSFVVYGCPRNHAHKLRISYALCLCACQENKCLLIIVGGGVVQAPVRVARSPATTAPSACCSAKSATSGRTVRTAPTRMPSSAVNKHTTQTTAPLADACCGMTVSFAYGRPLPRQH